MTVWYLVLYLTFDGNCEEAYAVYNSLAIGRKVKMPFESVFWGRKFGILTDKFRIISCNDSNKT